MLQQWHALRSTLRVPVRKASKLLPPECLETDMHGCVGVAQNGSNVYVDIGEMKCKLDCADDVS